MTATARTRRVRKLRWSAPVVIELTGGAALLARVEAGEPGFVTMASHHETAVAHDFGAIEIVAEGEAAAVIADAAAAEADAGYFDIRAYNRGRRKVGNFRGVLHNERSRRLAIQALARLRRDCPEFKLVLVQRFVGREEVIDA